MAFLNNLKFPNTQKIVIEQLRAKLPADFYVGLSVPKVKKDKMVIVLTSGGPHRGDAFGTIRVSTMLWYGNSWESCMDFGFELDSIMRGLEGEPFSPIVAIETTVLPTPSDDGDTSERPVCTAMYNFIVAASNN